jgi:hypothetical protein
VKENTSLAITVDKLIHHVRGQRIILDIDSARLYGVETFRFNEVVKRNQARFPKDFCFQPSKQELESLTSQITIEKPTSGRGGPVAYPMWFFSFQPTIPPLHSRARERSTHCKSDEQDN